MIPDFYGALAAVTVLWALLSGEVLALTQVFCIVMCILLLMPLRQRRLNNLPQIT